MANVRIRRIQKAGSPSGWSVAGAAPVTFDEDGLAVISEDDWALYEPHAASQGVFLVEKAGSGPTDLEKRQATKNPKRFKK